jgi:hypothetical protein
MAFFVAGSRVAGFQFPVAGCRFKPRDIQVTGYRLQVTGNTNTGDGCQSPVPGFSSFLPVNSSIDLLTG